LPDTSLDLLAELLRDLGVMRIERLAETAGGQQHRLERGGALARPDLPVLPGDKTNGKDRRRQSDRQ
jgi:hypothetical protein